MKSLYLLIMASIALIAMILVASTFALIESGKEQQDWEISDVDRYIGALDNPLSADIEWEAAALPDMWSQRDRNDDQASETWYRFRVPDELYELHAPVIYLARLYLNAEVFLDHYFLGSGGRLDAPVARNWNRPLLVGIPPDLLDASRHQSIYVRVVGSQTASVSYGLLAAMRVGAEDHLRPVYAINQFIRIEMSRAVTLLLGFIVFFGALLWLRLRQPDAALLALACLFWLLPATYAFLQFAPVGPITHLRLAHWGIDTAGLITLSFGLYRFNLLTRRVTIAVLVYAALLFTIHMLSPDQHLVRISNILHLPTLGMFAAMALFSGWRAVAQRDKFAVVFFCSISLLLLVFLHDVSLSLSLDPDRWRWDVHIAHLAMPGLFLTLAICLIRNFNSDLHRAQLVNQELEAMIAEEKKCLAVFYRDRHELARTNRLESEREIIYRDLHDDLGARLLSLVYSSQHARDVDLARTALQDLRDVVSRSSEATMVVEEVLSEALFEQETRCEKLGVLLGWTINKEFVGDQQFAAARALLLRRVVRELASIIIHQFSASSAKLSATIGHSEIEISLLVPISNGAISHEYAALESRLNRLGGRLSQSQDGGTCQLVLSLPIRTPAAQPSNGGV